MDVLPPEAAITPQRLLIIAPRCDVASWSPALTRGAAQHGIVTPRRVAHWLAHLVVESAGFTKLEEDLDYSAARLPVVWPKRFPTVASAQPYAHNPQALANKAYAGRGGNNQLGDGWRYRARGPIGRTFRQGYGEASAITGEDLVTNPDLLKRPDIGAFDAAGFWAMHGLNEIADEDANEAALAKTVTTLAQRVRLCMEDDLEAETLRVNGGETGLDARRAMLVVTCGVYRC